ncbi:MAG: hypothetical protein J5606_00330 [Bacteroidales bacterium]|nr:hypothetical protein [Bacteroidales bacterium]
MKNKILFFSLIMLLLVACHSSNTEVEEIILNVQQLPATITCGNAQNENTKVLDDNQSSFIIKQLKIFDKKFFTKINISENWIAECEIESFSSDFDIWLITNEGEPYLKLLVTVAENEKFIDLIPIACNVGTEKTKYVESEYWQASIDEEYRIIITKQYDKLYSLSDEGYESGKSVSKKTEDEYYIADNGTFVYVEKNIFNIDYKAIVMFADKEKLLNPLDDEWIWNAITIQENIESLDILFKEVYSDFDKVSIYNYQGEEVDIVDISNFISTTDKGFIILQKDKDPLFVPYGSPQDVLNKAMLFFEMPIIKIESENVPDENLTATIQ